MGKRLKYLGRLGAILFAVLMVMQFQTITVSAADRYLSDVQFTTGKYGQNCLTAENWSKSEKTLNLTQNVYLDAAAQQRANQGELKLTASVKVGANGSRTNTRRLEVKCYDKNGTQVGSTWKVESEKYSVSHHWNTLSVNDKTIPKNTYQIQYYVYNHIGTKGDLEIENCSLVIRDEVNPRITNITASTDDGRAWNQPHPAGTVVTYTISFSERVFATINLATDQGAPWIEPASPGITTGGVLPTADGASSTVSYAYTIPSGGNVISDNHNIAFRGLSSFSVWDDAGNRVTAGLTEDDVKKLNSGLASGGSLRMDNRPPELTGITSEGFSKGSLLTAGDTIKLHLTFHENIKVPGTKPYVTLSNGARAEYIPTATTTNLASFSYTVNKGDDVNGISISEFELSGIVDMVDQSSASSVRYDTFTAEHIGYMDVYGVSIDTLPPTITMPELSSDQWMGKDQLLEVTVTDMVSESLNGSGVKLVQYAWSQQASMAPGSFTDLADSESGTYSIPAPSSGGNWYLWMKCQDEAGNISDPVCSTNPALYDVTAPEIVLDKTEAGGKVIGAKVTFSDSESGVALRKYQWFDQENHLVDAGELSEDEQPTFPSLSGTYILKLYAEDGVKNSTSCEQEICVDRTAPNIVITAEGTGYAKSHVLTATCTDDQTKVTLVEYQWKPAGDPVDPEGWSPAADVAFPSPEQENGEWKLYVRATDSAGNQAVRDRSCLLDNKAPDIQIFPDGNEGNVGKEKYTVTVNAEDQYTLKRNLKVEYGYCESEDPSSISNWTVAEDPENISVEVILETDTYLHIKASDEAGNEIIKTSKVFAVDRNAPEGTMELNGKNITNNNTVNVTLDVSDDHSTAEQMQMQFQVDKDDWSEWEEFSKDKAITFSKEEGEHQISVRFRDLAGNVSENAGVTVVYDITPPVITLKYSEEKRTNQNVIVTAQLSDGSWISNDSHEFSTNGNYVFQAKDEAGNIGEKTAKVTWIDKTPPVFTLSSPEADAKPHKQASFSVASKDTDPVAYFYRIYMEEESAGDWEKMNGEKQELPELSDGTYIVEVYAKDDLGNSSVSQAVKIVLDNTPPKATVSYSPERRTSENVTATLVLEDASAVTVTEPEDGKFTYTFKENGSFTFRFTDEAGNTGNIEAKVDWIDRTLPGLDTVIRSASGETLVSGQWTDAPVTVELKRTHAAQTYDLLTFNGNDILGNSIQEVEGIEPVPNESDTYLVSSYGVLDYQITDTETNLTSNGSLLLAVDTKKPSCPDEAVQYSARDWTNQDVVVRIQAQDDHAKTITYLRRVVDEDKKERFEEDASGDTHVFTENGEHTFYFKDQAGNMESKTVTVNWIDKEKPQAKVIYTTEDGADYSPGTWTNQNITARLEFDSLSPVKMMEGEDQHLFTGNGSHTFAYIDAAGNQNTTKVTINRIDKVAPVGYMTASVEGWTNKNVEVVLHASDDASGAEDMSHLFTSNGSHNFVLKDKAGNESVYTYSMERIDKQAPEIQFLYTPANDTKTPFSVYVNATANERVRWEDNSSSWKFEKNGTHSFTAVDRAGNSTTETASVDWISPDLPEVQLIYSTTETTNQDVQVELCTTDSNASIRVLSDGGSRFYTFRENGKHTFRYTDAAGKNIGVITAEVTWIDNVAPELTVQMDCSELVKEPVKVTVSANEPVTWPNGMTVVDEMTATVEYEENIAAQIWAEDALGNRGYVQFVIDCIDNQAPEIVMENKDVCIPLGESFDPMDGVTAEDEHPGESLLQVEGDVDTESVGEYRLTYVAADAVGNTAVEERTVYVYDPEQFQVMVNGRLYVKPSERISIRDNKFELIHSEGDVSVKLLAGKASAGDFKTKGTSIEEQLLDGSYTFPGVGYYTLLIQDQERNTKLVQLYVAE